MPPPSPSSVVLKIIYMKNTEKDTFLGPSLFETYKSSLKLAIPSCKFVNYFS